MEQVVRLVPVGQLAPEEPPPAPVELREPAELQDPVVRPVPVELRDPAAL